MTCLIRIENEKECRVCDPCHCTGKYRGAAYSICNLLYKGPKESIPVAFHSDSNHNYLFTVHDLAEKFEG